ncbi:hypothetical protein YPPY64_2255, partial [Yersinia pestis PY-64]
MAIAIS